MQGLLDGRVETRLAGRFYVAGACLSGGSQSLRIKSVSGGCRKEA